MWGEKKRQGEARPREGGHTTQAHMWGTHAGRQWETRGDKGGQEGTRPRQGRRTIQQRKIRRETRLQKRGHTIQDREIRRDTKGDKTGGTGRHHPTQGDKAGQDLGKAGASSATGTHVGRHRRQAESAPHPRHVAKACDNNTQTIPNNMALWQRLATWRRG